MFRNIARASLRRGLHTARPVSVSAGFSRHRLAMAAGASVAAAAYLGWRMTTDNQAIALDSDTSAPRATETTGHPSTSEPSGSSPVSPSENPEQEQQLSDATEGIPSEEEAASQGAFDPVTGKINWDCPCLGGMAYGPCGMQFREAFSCFVFSEEEPKGIDCVEKFKAMQDCFKENPDVYGEEIMRDDDEEEELTAPSSAPEDTIPALNPAPLASSVVEPSPSLQATPESA